MAEDGLELVEICRQFGPDVVVTDYGMPGLDWASAAAEVNRERWVPVILITGRHDLTLPDGGGHVVACLSKPVKAGELKAVVENATQGEPPPAGSAG